MSTSEHPADKRNPAENYHLGLRALWFITLDLFADQKCAFEMRQLKKRLEREYTKLGKLTYPALADYKEGDTPPEPDETTVLCIKQVEFLVAELKFLAAERERKRGERISKRADKLGFPIDEQTAS